MNPDLETLQPYPFERLNALKAGVEPPSIPHIALSIGEPKHATPPLIAAALRDSLDVGLSRYPTTRGSDALREAVCTWLTQRYGLAEGMLDPAKHALPVAGTREALFSFAQAVVDTHRAARVLMPNPFYQIYEGAALLAGAAPEYIPCTPETAYLPDFDQVSDKIWNQCQLLYLCSPGNPSFLWLFCKVRISSVMSMEAGQ